MENVLNSGMTIKELSEKSGVPENLISGLLHDKEKAKKCDVETFLKLAKVLKISMDELYKLLTMRKIEGPTRSGKGLPEKFRGDFWDTNFEELDTEYNKDFIIIRLFMHGGTPGYLYVNETYSKREIQHAIRTRRDLNPIVADFLSKTYDVPREEMIYYQFVHDVGNDWMEF